MRTAALVTFAFVSFLSSLSFAADEKNLVANGDFSQVTAGKPDQWSLSGNRNDVVQTLEPAKDADGKPCARLVCTKYERSGPDSHAMITQVGIVNLSKGKLYEFSCRMRAEGMRAKTVGVGIQETQGWLPSGFMEQVSTGEQWKTYRFTFSAMRDIGPTGRLQIWFTEPGTLYLADVRIVELQVQDVEFTDVVERLRGKNLVPNGSFEVGAAGWSTLGAGAGWGDTDRLHGTVETGDATHGKSFLRIPLGGDRTPVLYFDYYQPVVRRELRPLAASRGWIKVEKGQPYTVSADMRASVDGTRATLGVRTQDPVKGWPNDLTTAVTLTKEWKRYSFTFRPKNGYAFVTVGPDLTEEKRVDVDLDAVQLEKGDKATAFEPREDIEFAIEPSQQAGIFTEGEPASLILRVVNHGKEPVKTAVRFAVKDFDDKLVPFPDAELDVPGGAAATRELKLPADWKGYYCFGELGGSGGRLRLAIVPKRTATDSVLGINHAFTTASLIRLASKAGVMWYRDWTLKWQFIEPAKGEFRWDIGDAQIDRVLREGVHVLPLLPPFPSADWSSEAPDTLPKTGYPGVRLRQAWGPKDPKDLGNFVELAAAHYKDRLHLYEFLNEPIYTSYALPADRENKYGGKKYAPADYVSLLAVATAGIKRGDPAARVIAGIAGHADRFARDVIEAGCLKHCDLFNLHMYPGSRRPESFIPEMDELLAFMDARGGRKPIWITEFSYYATDDLPRKPFFPFEDDWAEHRLLEGGEKQCADWTIRYFTLMLSRGTEKVFIHSGASGRVNQPSLECALFAYGGAPRKLLPALAVFTELLGPKPVFAGERALGTGGHCSAFETGKQSVLVFWKEDDDALGEAAPASEARGGQGAVDSPAAGVKWMDVMGRTLAARPVALSTSPAYLVGPSGKAKELLASMKLAAP